MKRPKQLTKRELVDIVSTILAWLYRDRSTAHHIAIYHGQAFAQKLQQGLDKSDVDILDYYNPDCTWDAADIVDSTAELLDNYKLVPTKVMTVDEMERKPTPEENWKDDAIQFPRLLDELQGVGVVNLLKEVEWEALEQSMDLPRKKIMQIFARAQKEWDRIKEETK